MAEKTLTYTFKAKDDGTVALLNKQGEGADQLKAKMQKMNEASVANSQQSFRALERMQQETAALQAQADADRLRSLGRELDAELALVRANAEAKKQILQQSLTSQIDRAKDPGMADPLRAAGADKTAAIDQAAAAEEEALRSRQARQSAKEIEALRQKEFAAFQQKIAGQSNKGMMDQLYSQLGRGSSVGKLAELARGAGIGLAVTATFDIVGNAAEKIHAINQQFADGKLSSKEYWGSVAEGAVESVPLLNTVYDSMKKMAVAFGYDDGSKTMAQEKARVGVLDYEDDEMKQQKKDRVKQAMQGLKADQRLQRAGLQGFSAQAFDKRVAMADESQALNDQRLQDRDAAEEEYKKQRQAIQQSGADGDTISKSEEKLDKEHKARLLEIDKNYQQLQQQQTAAGNAELKALSDQANREALQTIREYQKQATDINDQAAADRLRTLGREFEAELLMLKKSADDQKTEIQQKLLEVAKLPAEQQAAARAALQAQANAVDSNRMSQQQNLTFTTLRDEQLKLLQRQGEAGDYLAAAELKRLQVTRETTEENAKLLAIINGQASARDKDTAQALLKQITDAQRDEVAKALRDAQEGTLERESQLGRTPMQRLQATKDLEKLRLQDELKKQEADAIAFINLPGVTKAQQQERLQQLKDWGATTGAEYDKAVVGDQPERKHTFDLQERGLLLSGVGAAARAHQPQDDVVRKTEEGNQIMGKMQADIAKLVQYVTGGGNQPPSALQKNLLD